MRTRSYGICRAGQVRAGHSRERCSTPLHAWRAEPPASARSILSGQPPISPPPTGPSPAGQLADLPTASSVTVDFAIPVHNEQRALPGAVSTLHAYLAEHLPFPWWITVVDSASTDATVTVAEGLVERFARVRLWCLDQKGKGLAVRTAWQRSEAAVLAYMDVDLSTGLDALLPLVAPLVNGHSDLSVGTRHAPGSRIVRSGKREVLSRGYNLMLRLAHGVRFTDAQCGFKAGRAEVLRPLLAHLVDNEWFFDSELLLLAAHNGLRVHEVAVDWVEDLDSRVDLVRTIGVNLRGVLRLARARRSGAALVTGLPVRPALRPTHPDAVLRARSSPVRCGVALGRAVALAAGAAGITVMVATRASTGQRGPASSSVALPRRNQP